jgi:purine-binding chemotaxis protein CheW
MTQTTDHNSAQASSADLQAAFADDTMQVVSFKVGDEHYGIDIQLVREIRAWQVATQLPNTPSFVRGVINLRGTIVPILDLRARFGQGTTEPGTAHVVIVVAVGTRIVGILVDSVSDIVTLPKGDIKAVPTMEGSAASDCLDGLVTVNEQMIALVSVERVASAATVH